MEKRLRKKFIKIAMMATSLSLILIFLAIIGSNYYELNRRADHLLHMVIDNGGRFPAPKERDMQKKSRENMLREDPFSTRYFTIRTDAQGEIRSVNLEKISTVSEESAITYAQQALSANRSGGFIEHYKYKKHSSDEGWLIVFVDLEREFQIFDATVFYSMIVLSGSLILIFAALTILSKKAVAPIVKAYDKQQRFITDASHELKTPLTVIRTNAEVLLLKKEDSKWIRNIFHQIDRMDHLVEDMILLTKLDEQQEMLPMTRFDLSNMAQEVADIFSPIAASRSKTLELRIEPDLFYEGQREQIERLLSLLLENAVKYSDEESQIRIDVYQKNGIFLSVENAAKSVRKGDHGHLLERFARLDSHRNSKTGGYGIGLSLAERIIRNHGGTIRVFSPADGQFRVEICFRQKSEK